MIWIKSRSKSSPQIALLHRQIQSHCTIPIPQRWEWKSNADSLNLVIDQTFSSIRIEALRLGSIIRPAMLVFVWPYLLRFISLEWWSKESRNMTRAVWWHWAPLTAFLALCDTLTPCSRVSLRLWYRHRHWASPNSAGCSGTSWAHEADVFMDFEVHLISVWSGLFVKYFCPSSFLTPEYSCRSLLWVHTPTEPVFIAGHACSLILCFWLLIWALWLDCFLNGLQVSCAAFDSFQ